MSHANGVITLGIGASNPEKMEYFLLTGLESSGTIVYVEADTTLYVIVAPDDFSVIVDEDTEYADFFDTVNLVDENGNFLVDENGNQLVAIEVATGQVYSVIVPLDEFIVIVEEDQ